MPSAHQIFQTAYDYLLNSEYSRKLARELIRPFFFLSLFSIFHLHHLDSLESNQICRPLLREKYGRICKNGRSTVSCVVFFALLFNLFTNLSTFPHLTLTYYYNLYMCLNVCSGIDNNNQKVGLYQQTLSVYEGPNMRNNNRCVPYA